MKPSLTPYGLAFNVKDYHPYGGEGTDAQRSKAYARAQAAWWTSADFACQCFGFRGCYADGRSSGWLVPTPQPADPERLTAEEKARFDRLGESLDLQLHDAERLFLDMLADVIAEEVTITDALFQRHRLLEQLAEGNTTHATTARAILHVLGDKA